MLVFSGGTNVANATGVSRDVLMSVFVFRLAEHLQWPNSEKIKQYNIHIVDEDDGVYEALSAIAKTKRLHGKPVFVTKGVMNADPKSTQIVFVPYKSANNYLPIYNSIGSRPVLMIADRLDNHRVVMIDIHDDGKGKLYFEINKANILNRGISIHPDIILLGGTEIDVAELYKEGQDELKKQSQKLISYRKEIEILERESASQLSQIEQQTAALSKMKAHDVELQERITSQQKLISELESRSESERKTYIGLREQVVKQKINLENQAEFLKKRGRQLAKQLSEIDARSGVLEG